MKKLMRTLSILLIAILLTTSTTGCWNRREIEKLNFVLGAGIDTHPQGLLLSTQVANPKALGAKGGGDQPTFFTFTATGQTVFDAIRKSTHASQFKLFWAHTKVIIFSEEMARKGVLPPLEYFSRDAETRRNFLIAVTPGRAEEILKMNVQTEKVPILSLLEILELYTATSTSPKVNVNDFLRTYHTSQSVMVPTVLKVHNQGTKVNYYLKGSSVFKKDRFVAYFTPIETRGVFWVRGDVKSTILVTNCLQANEKEKLQKVSFEVFSSSAETKAEKKNGKITITVKIKEAGNIAGSTCTKNETDKGVLKKLEELKAKKIKGEVNAALKAAKKHKTDVFGFGEAIHRAYPKEWKAMEKDWPNLFTRIPITIEVDSKITAGALIQRQSK
ncbi:Ger(x)C family spore germination protein [Brevibacillus sp. SYSU BS000544]|uniref:Ger(x)C family spore germination protein n=1 Tax=Brevibacillus sp. SYSU BS000544 TaxID=3416443 RepID=UPI003CE5BEB9